ncbi:uncharacterized protein LOC141606458 isoform X3 [Silene latifolia]|uniref:uncharacterized protein LOC141606458 isoform X3 n=1 Tax=Silene latifolia TaxID=37657 RepID=UPI003D789154
MDSELALMNPGLSAKDWTPLVTLEQTDRLSIYKFGFFSFGVRYISTGRQAATMSLSTKFTVYTWQCWDFALEGITDCSSLAPLLRTLPQVKVMDVNREKFIAEMESESKDDEDPIQQTELPHDLISEMLLT